MKALEWAMINPHRISTTCSQRHIQSVLEDASTEIIRLAEMNVLLFKAINDLSVTAVSTKPGEFSVASHALFALQAAANKAKEL